MAKKLMKNYPLGIARPMPRRVAKMPARESYRAEAYRPNSHINRRPRESH